MLFVVNRNNLYLPKSLPINREIANKNIKTGSLNSKISSRSCFEQNVTDNSKSYQKHNLIRFLTTSISTNQGF